MASRHLLQSDNDLEHRQQGDISQTKLRRSLRLSQKRKRISGALREEQQYASRKQEQKALEISAETNKRQKRSYQDHGRLQSQTDSISHWCEFQNWPKTSSKMDVRPDLLARKRSLSRKRSFEGSTVTSQSNVQTREEKITPYRSPQYEDQLRAQGFYLELNADGPKKSSLERIHDLLRQQPTLPEKSVFDDKRYINTLNNLRTRNEAKIIREVGALLVPSPEQTEGDEHMKHLVDSVDSGWNSTIPITPIRPQPDYSVGFRPEAFTAQQLAKIRPILGDGHSMISRLKATWYMYFPFMCAEVKSSAGPLIVAERQNAHSAGIAVRAIVSLYQLLNREQELDREILAFSICHDSRTVWIYGHYPVVNETITYYQHLIVSRDLWEDRWAPFRFVTSVYQIWAAQHLQRIRSILDELSEEMMPPPSEQMTQGTGLSQVFTESSLSFQGSDPAPEAPTSSKASKTLETSATSPETEVSKSKNSKGRAADARHRKAPRSNH